MASDMLVALGTTTDDRSTLFGHNSNRPQGETAALLLAPGSDHSPGDTDRTGLPEARHTWTVLACRAYGKAGYVNGVNEKGVAIGWTPIATRLSSDEPALTGPELVRLGLERAASACQAVEIITNLVSRHGQEGSSSLLIADTQEAFLIETASRHWALAQVRRLRAVCSTSMLRQDWDRISRGLSDVAINCGWWPEDGCKLDFAAALGRTTPAYPQIMRRWGRATMTLEHHAGEIDTSLIRRVLSDQASGIGSGETYTAACFVASLGREPGDLPLAWCAFGPPESSVYIPVLVCGELPSAFDGRLSENLMQARREARRETETWLQWRAALAEVQIQLDEQAHDFAREAHKLHRLGQCHELRRLASVFMHHAVERVEEVLTRFGTPTGAMMSAEMELQGAFF